MKRKLLSALFLPLLFSCEKTGDTLPEYKVQVSKQGISLPYKVLTTLSNKAEVRNGGFGSGMTAHPTLSGNFYALTDRGPNASFTGSAGKGKKFPIPSYTPRIGQFRLNAQGKPELVKEILFKNPAGQLITGLPNPEGRGATGEVPYDKDGNVLNFDDYGLDSEGLVALKNGEFWVSDEYGPHIVHYDSEGKELERISPIGVNTGGRKIPAVFKRRRANRGMEGLAITPDEKTLVGIMQSTLYNPSKAEVTNKTLTRIVTFELSTGKTKQYLYRQEKDWNSNSEIVALSNTSFLVIERDGKFSGEESAQKHLYKIDISRATDVSSEINDVQGKVIDGKTLEQLTWDEVAFKGIKVAEKSLVLDLVSYLPNNYPHDKLEGLWLINKNTIGVLNDDDFGVESSGSEVIQKILPGTKHVDTNTLYLLDVSL